MENVWGELKKIEAQALQITSDAQDKAKQIVAMSKQDAQKLVNDSKINAEAEAQKLYTDAVAKATQEREEQLKLNQTEIKKLKLVAEQGMDQAVDLIVKAVLEEQ
jgi:vacuolar-type H+-ATPase subunit H